MTYSKLKTGLLLGFVILIWATQNLSAQDGGLNSKAGKFVGENAGKYLQPAVAAFSANLNSGLYHTADVHDFLGFEVGLVGMLAPIPDDKKTFLATAPDSIIYQNRTYISGRDYDRIITTSTALGPKQGTKVYYKIAAPGSPSIYQFPGGINLKSFPIATPQLSAGLPLGTEFILRYLPETKISDEVGKLKLVGIGLRHSVSQWFHSQSLDGSPVSVEFPLNISINFMYQKFTLRDSAGGDFIDTKAVSAGVQASKKFLIFTVYGGLAYENATTDISYTYRPVSEYYPEARNAPVRVKLESLKGENNLRFTGGLNIHLFILDVFADYSFASQSVASLGIVLSIR